MSHFVRDGLVLKETSPPIFSIMGNMNSNNKETANSSSSQNFSFENTLQEVVDLNVYYLDMVECPLDPVHIVRRHRLATHLLRCRKNFPTKKKCPYNHCYIEQHEMASNLQICSYKPQADVMPSHVMEAEYNRTRNITYNYDVNNHISDEPFWE